MKFLHPPHIFAFIAMALLPVSGAQAELDFTKDIRPILSDKCFACHGPDEATRKAKLGLHLEASVRERKVIVKGDPAASPLITRINSTDPEEHMPPPDSNLTLTDEEKARLAQWVKEGAKFEPHWAFKPVAEVVEAPPVQSAWVRNPIDVFVLARLQQEGLTPSEEARRETLIRRLSFDLTGLPPTPEEVAAFLADTAPDAYEMLVDTLLSRPAYGERMANQWLDTARFADTYGYQSDRDILNWPWRDWVIKAFNENLHYDDFLRWQIAGDLLPEATQEQQLATMFCRLHRQTNEGGSVPEEFRIQYVADRTQTVATAFLGLTLECAQCHDHKFDPISQKNYYEMSAFFNSIDESGMYSHFTDATPSPSLMLYTDEQRGKRGAFQDLLADQVNALPLAKGIASVRFFQWLQNPERQTPDPKPVLHFPFEVVADDKTPNTADDKQPGELGLSPELVPGMAGQAMRFSGESSITNPQAGNFERIDPFSMALWVNQAESVPHTVLAHKCIAELDAASRGWELLLEDGKPTFSLVHFWPGNALRVQSRDAIEAGVWTHIAVTYDGSSRAAGVRIYLNGESVSLEVIRDHLVKTIRYPDSTPLMLAARFRDIGLKNGMIDEFMLFDRRLAPIEARALATQQSMAQIAAPLIASGDTSELLEYYLLTQDAPYAEALNRVYRARKEEFDVVNSVMDVMTMQETPEPRQAYVLERGGYDAHRDPVYPNTPENIMVFAEDLPRNRLGLADWMLDEKNPLTARVAVNRYWAIFFGKGIVETQEDFGSQGRLPSHPELLDYLARWFMDNNWDIKALCKLIVTSATYRQDSTPREELQEIDPYNVLLARGPRHRLSAEQIRDNALASSGLLVPTIGGPSVKIYQPDGLWEDSSSNAYVQDHGDALYRRSMYTFWKRTVPHPAMLTFDAAPREVCTSRREITQTPLQALILLNDTQFVEASRVLAEKIVAERKPLKDDINQIFLCLASRAPDAEEAKILESAYREQRAYFKENKEGAAAYIKTGEKAPNENLDSVDLAAMTALVQAVMNFDEFQVKQ